MVIPKLARGGIINNNLPLLGEVEVDERVMLLKDNYDKGYKIYKRSKNRRIKKKQLKKYPIVRIKLQLEKYFKTNKEIKIVINGNVIERLEGEENE